MLATNIRVYKTNANRNLKRKKAAEEQEEDEESDLCEIKIKD